MKSSDPTLWLIRNDAMPRRLALHEGQLRTVVDLETLVTARIQAFDVNQITRITVVGPYARPRPPILFATAALALGIALGDTLPNNAKIAVFTSVCVAALLSWLFSSIRTVEMRLAQAVSGCGAFWFAYKLSESGEVQKLFPKAEWDDHLNLSDGSPGLTLPEIRRIEILRLSIVMCASSAAFFACYFISPSLDQDKINFVEAVPFISCFLITIFVAAVGSYKMIVHHSSRL